MAKKKDNKDRIQEMFRYTARDNGQEYIMKKKMLRAVFIAIITLIALAVFIALYLDEKKTVQQTFRKEYKACIEKVIDDIESYNNAEGDFEFRYRRIVADMNSVSSFAFLIDDFEEEQKAINELYTVFLKYPDQMQEDENLEAALQALKDIDVDLDKGYDEARELVDSIDLKGY